jgi:outer membrane protein assembly factor BamB
VAVGPYNDPSPYGYSVYFGTDDNRLYRVVLSVDQQGSWVTQVAPGWPYQCDGVPVGTPALGMAGNEPAVYVSNTSGLIHCIHASTGSRIWRSAQLGAITPPLYAPSPFGATNGSRVYVGNSGWQILAFETSYSGSPENQPPVWYVWASGPLLRTPSAGYGPLPLEESRWRIYVYAATGLSTLDKIVDKGASGEVA